MARPTEYHWIGMRADGRAETSFEPRACLSEVRDDCRALMDGATTLDLRVVYILDANGHLVDEMNKDDA